MYRNMHQVYIIYSSSKDRYYVGSTSVGVQLRVDRHNEGWTRSTKNGTPWELKYIKSFDVKTAALKYELFLKRQKSRPFLEKLITSEENELSW